MAAWYCCRKVLTSLFSVEVQGQVWSCHTDPSYNGILDHTFEASLDSSAELTYEPPSEDVIDLNVIQLIPQITLQYPRHLSLMVILPTTQLLCQMTIHPSLTTIVGCTNLQNDWN